MYAEYCDRLAESFVLTKNGFEKLQADRTAKLCRRLIELEAELAKLRLYAENMQHLAHFDALTGLPNRLLLIDRCHCAEALADRNGQGFSFLFVDVDKFKMINDSLGHSVGDRVLLELASRLRSLVREQDTISRLGGDEFVLLLPNTLVEGAAQVAEKVLRSVSKPFYIESRQLAITLSIGIAMYPQDGQNFDDLCKCSDTAMYLAKGDGRNGYKFYGKGV